MSDKYIQAIAAYCVAQQEVKRLSKAIGDAIGQCMETQCPDGIFPTSPIVEHLKEAYSYEKGEYGGREWTYDDPADYLAEVCPHCLLAHNLIQERKEARKKFGTAKRRITVLGKSIKEQPL